MFVHSQFSSMSVIILILLECFLAARCAASNKTENIEIVGWDTKETKSYLFLTIFIFVVSFGKLCYHKFHFISSYVPESFLLIIFGIFTGAIISYGSINPESVDFTPEMFFLILLPPIVLDSAYHMYNRTFGEILGIIIILAVLGTVFCFLIIAFALYGLEYVGAMGEVRPTNTNLMAILLFSSLIVAVDPVAVLAIFKDLGVDKELYYMIFGESLLNDAVTIVLYEIMKQFIILGKDGINVVNILLGFVSFFTVSFGGLLIGIVIGVLSSLLTRFQSTSDVHCVTILASAYLSYILAYSLKWSGIISIIGCGIIQAAYGFRNITKDNQMILKNCVELLAGVSEAIIFVFLGLEVFLVEQIWNVGFQLSSIILCIMARFLVILILRTCINYVKVDQRQISWTELFITTYGGLRGAVAFSLVILIEPELLYKGGDVDSKTVRGLFVTTTLLIIIFTVSFMGTTMKPLAKLLSVKSEKQKLLSVYNELNSNVIDNLMSALEVLLDQKGRNRFRLYLSNFDNHYIRPWLLNDPYDNNTFKIIKRYEQISLALHYAGLNNKVAEEHLSDVPKSLWPKMKIKPIKQNVENFELKVIKNMRKLSNMVRHADPIALRNKNHEFSGLLESAFDSKLNNIIRRKSAVCHRTQRIKLPPDVADLTPFHNRWQSMNDDGTDDPGNILPASSSKINRGFSAGDEIQMANYYKQTPM